MKFHQVGSVSFYLASATFVGVWFLVNADVWSEQGGISDQRAHLTGQFLNPEEQETTYCYQCESSKDKECKSIDPLDIDAKYKFNLPCLNQEKYNGTRPFCRKITQKIFTRDNMEIVIRKCGWVKHARLDCYSVRNEDHMETICQCFEPGCNGVPSLQLPSALVTSALLLKYLHY